MGQLKVEKKEWCEGCQVKFSNDLPYHAMNMCLKCYMNWKQPRKGSYQPRANSKDKWTHCLECKFEFNTLGHKGKLVVYGSSGLCRRCYGRLYNKNIQKFCQKCERQIIGSTKPLCKICQEIEKEEFYKNNPKKQPRSYKQKLKVLEQEISTEQYELIRRLLVKFKLNMFSYVDYFRVADVYVDIYDHEAHLDAYTEHDQVAIMLKRLKDIWLHNRDIRQAKRIKEKEKLDKKIKRLLKL